MQVAGSSRDSRIQPGSAKTQSRLSATSRTGIETFARSLPATYPKPHPFPGEKGPYPLLLSLPEAVDRIDGRGEAAPYPGRQCLRRRYPRDAWGTLHDRWLLLSPVAEQAGFLKPDGRIRHDRLTAVLTQFWRHYHVDFDRIVIDGHEAAAALVAAFPVVFAGVVLRPGTVVDADVVRNYASVPVYVWGDKRLAAMLKSAGHPDVTNGTDDHLFEWLEKRRPAPSR